LKVKELIEVDQAVDACNALQVADQVRIALVNDLRPIADRLPEYKSAAASIIVETGKDAERAAILCDAIAADIKTVKSHEILSKITDGLHQLHRRWTGLRDVFVSPMEDSRRKIKQQVVIWQEAEARRAAEIQRKAQAEADAKAAREREALLKKAEAVKTEAKKEEYQERAAAVIAPTITVTAPKAIKVSRVWVGRVEDESKFYAALAVKPELRGFVEINTTRLSRAKAANPNMEIEGIKFEQVVR
jgi:hypothetical protein